jgi:hypothetical protein
VAAVGKHKISFSQKTKKQTDWNTMETLGNEIC